MSPGRRQRKLNRGDNGLGFETGVGYTADGSVGNGLNLRPVGYKSLRMESKVAGDPFIVHHMVLRVIFGEFRRARRRVGEHFSHMGLARNDETPERLLGFPCEKNQSPWHTHFKDIYRASS